MDSVEVAVTAPPNIWVPSVVTSLLNVVFPVTVIVPAEVKRILPEVIVDKVRLAPVTERLLA